jgi:LAGLIDADG DNA endonuclease family
VCRGSPIDNSPGRLTHPRTGGRRGAVPIENPAGLAGGPGVKVIPDSVIMYNLLTPIAFAHWTIGEGLWAGSGLVLCTNSFSIIDNVKLINILNVRYQLECILDIIMVCLLFILKQVLCPVFVLLFVPYMDSTILYKLGL